MDFTEDTMTQINSNIEKYFIFQWTEQQRDPPNLPLLEDLPKFVQEPAPSTDPQTGELIESPEAKQNQETEKVREQFQLVEC